MLTVEADAASVEERLRSGGLVCPFCNSVLAGWGFARRRRLRGVDGPVALRPRRAVCTGCGRTQVLLPVVGLSRRADVALIHQTSRGLPRAVNNLAVQALIAAFATDKAIVDESSTRAAITEVTTE